MCDGNSARIGAWDVKLEIMTDRPTDESTDRYGEVSLSNLKMLTINTNVTNINL